MKNHSKQAQQPPFCFGDRLSWVETVLLFVILFAFAPHISAFVVIPHISAWLYFAFAAELRFPVVFSFDLLILCLEARS